MSDPAETRLARLEVGQTTTLQTVDGIRTTMDSLGNSVSELRESVSGIKGMLMLLVPTLQNFDGRFRAMEAAQAELRDEMRGGFEQMSLRISDLSARLPTLIAWQPPDQRRA